MQIKDVRTNDDLNVYAGELAVEMRIYCQNRLENIYDNVQSIIKRLKSLKPKKKGAKKHKKTTETEEDKGKATEERESKDTELSARGLNIQEEAHVPDEANELTTPQIRGNVKIYDGNKHGPGEDGRAQTPKAEATPSNRKEATSTPVLNPEAE